LKKLLNSFIFAALAFSAVGCASINSVSLTPIPKERNKTVRAQASKIIFLGFNFDNDFIDGIVTDIKSQCPNGKVTGLLTKDQNINYFLYFVWKKQVDVTGYCVSNSTSNTQTTKRGTASTDTNENLGVEE
jgi:hypothetical protein